MEPLTVYVTLFTLFVILGVLVVAFRHRITRVCPQCGTKVELGRQRCQACAYRFSTAR